MEISQKGIDEFEVVSGIDEEVGLPRARQNITGMLIGSKLEGADGGCADGDDPFRLAACFPDFLGGFFGDGVDLGMKMVIFNSLGANGLEGPEADVQSDFGSFDSSILDAGENFSSEVEAGGRGGNRSTLLRVDRLIAFAVAKGIITVDVGRERNVSDLVDAGEKIIDGIKADAALSE